MRTDPFQTIGQVAWDDDEVVAAIDTFMDIYAQRPVPKNIGGMGFNHCFAVWFMLRKLAPPLVIESGVFKGQGTWLIEEAVPAAEIICLDLDFRNLIHRCSKAEYIEQDFGEIDWSKRDLHDAVAIFDDHQNAYRRLKEMHWVGLRTAIFEDNYPVEEGDAYSLRHILAGSGHPEPQWSKRYRRGLKRRLRYAKQKRFLSEIGANQTIVRQPNGADRANLGKRLKTYYEFPPAYLPAVHPNWKKPFTGQMASRRPLLTTPPRGFDGGYSFICLAQIDGPCRRQAG